MENIVAFIGTACAGQFVKEDMLRRTFADGEKLAESL